MSFRIRSCIRRIRLVHGSQLNPVIIPARRHHVSPISQSAFAPTSIDFLQSQVQQKDPQDLVREERLRDVLFAVEGDVGPGRVWAYYDDLLKVSTFSDIPLEIHQKVLRKCTLPALTMRQHLIERISKGYRFQPGHMYEARLQSVISNIQEAGYTPSIEDYEFILEQFATVGYHLGAIQVLQEITYLGLPKSERTYGFALQALAHRLKLPCAVAKREQLVEDCSKICLKLLNEMWSLNIPITAHNVNLTIRVLKGTLDLQGLERLMKYAYGIDLSYPDRAPVEFWDSGRQAKPQDGGVISSVPGPQPFGTAELNTTIDALGRIGNISKMIQTFEVLTTPLPSSTTTTPPQFEYDDDDFGENNPSVAPYTAPHAQPNTTTYVFLLRWITEANHSTLARHYLLQAMQLDREADRRVRGDCLRKAENEIPALRFSMNRSMLLSVYGYASRRKDTELLRWLLVKTRRVLRRKRVDIEFYSEIQKKWRQERKAVAEEVEVDGVVVDSSLVSETETSPAVVEGSSSSSSSSPPTKRAKLFDIERHLESLRSEVEAIEQLELKMMDGVGRTTQRIKERLGRRVWAGKDIYLHSGSGRDNVSQEDWKRLVNFRTKREVRQSLLPSMVKRRRRKDDVGGSTSNHVNVKPPKERKKNLRMTTQFASFITSRMLQNMSVLVSPRSQRASTSVRLPSPTCHLRRPP
ncbi:hypothetical protein ABKN59_000212 [Abortiporus biennis]